MNHVVQADGPVAIRGREAVPPFNFRMPSGLIAKLSRIAACLNSAICMGCSLLRGGFRRVSDLLRKVWVERRGTLPARLRRVAARSTVWPNLQYHIEQAQMRTYLDIEIGHLLRPAAGDGPAVLGYHEVAAADLSRDPLNFVGGLRRCLEADRPVSRIRLRRHRTALASVRGWIAGNRYQ